MKKRINVLVVDDSAFMRKIIADFLEGDPRIEVVGTARNGLDALKKIESLNPDVVTLDVEMPVMDGLEALQKIMQQFPRPVLMVSSTTKQGAENTVLAMEYGAIDFIAKPSGAISLDLYKVKEELVDKVITAASVKIKVMKKPQVPVQTNSLQDFEHIKGKNLEKKIILIGTSTGGPKALQEVLTKLPKEIDAPILIVQHMPASFTKSLANRLDNLSEVSVKEAEDGEIIKKGVAYIAPGGYHLKIRKAGTSLIVQLDQEAPRNGHRPSVDVMFESATQLTNYSKISVIMTGMGSDGTKGLIALKKAGNVFSIAESEESAVVYGMPKSAVLSDNIDQVVHLQQIASLISKYCSTSV